jgi:hypothetical protein
MGGIRIPVFAQKRIITVASAFRCSTFARKTVIAAIVKEGIPDIVLRIVLKKYAVIDETGGKRIGFGRTPHVKEIGISIAWIEAVDSVPILNDSVCG